MHFNQLHYEVPFDLLMDAYVDYLVNIKLKSTKIDEIKDLLTQEAIIFLAQFPYAKILLPGGKSSKKQPFLEEILMIEKIKKFNVEESLKRRNERLKKRKIMAPLNYSNFCVEVDHVNNGIKMIRSTNLEENLAFIEENGWMKNTEKKALLTENNQIESQPKFVISVNNLFFIFFIIQRLLFSYFLSFFFYKGKRNHQFRTYLLWL
jgi:hypothetical protein